MRGRARGGTAAPPTGSDGARPRWRPARRPGERRRRVARARGNRSRASISRAPSPGAALAPVAASPVSADSKRSEATRESSCARSSDRARSRRRGRREKTFERASAAPRSARSPRRASSERTTTNVVAPRRPPQAAVRRYRSRRRGRMSSRVHATLRAGLYGPRAVASTARSTRSRATRRPSSPSRCGRAESAVMLRPQSSTRRFHGPDEHDARGPWRRHRPRGTRDGVGIPVSPDLGSSPRRAVRHAAGGSGAASAVTSSSACSRPPSRARARSRRTRSLIPGDLFDAEGVDAETADVRAPRVRRARLPARVHRTGQPRPARVLEPLLEPAAARRAAARRGPIISTCSAAPGWTSQPLAGHAVTLWGRCFTTGAPTFDRPLEAQALALGEMDPQHVHIGLFHGSREQHCPPGQELTAPFSDVEVRPRRSRIWPSATTTSPRR